MATMTNFWNYKTMLAHQAYLLSRDLNKDCYLDNNNILRDKNKPEKGLAYVGGDMRKVVIGENITNKLRIKTSSFQYVYGTTPPLIREDGMEVGGPLVELIAEPNLEDWLESITLADDKSRRQVYSLIMQLCYAAYLLSLELGSIEKAMTGIRIRQVKEEATVPFFNGNVKSYGVVPVITDLANIQTNIDNVDVRDIVIPYLLNIVSASSLGSLDWSQLEDNYPLINIRNGNEWNDILKEDIFSQEGIATLTCDNRSCLSTFTSSNGKNDSSHDSSHDNSHELELLKATELPLLDNIRPFALAFSALILDEKSPFVEDYLHPELIEETLDDLERDKLYLEEVKEKKYRKVIYPDLRSSSTTNEYYIREKNHGLRPVRRDHLTILDGTINYINQEEGILQPLDQDDVYVRNTGNIPQLVDNSYYLLELGLRYLGY